MLLCLKPFTSISKAVFIVSTKSAQLPEFIPERISPNFSAFFTEF